MAYTDAQIQEVCKKATEVMHGLTDAQNVTFPTTAIIDGMKKGLSAEVISANARKAIDDLPLYNNGTFNLTGSSINMFNLSSYMAGVVYNEISKLENNNQQQEPQEPEPQEPQVEEPTVTITSVTLNKNATSIALGGTETLSVTVVASPDEVANKAVTWSLGAENDKVTVVGGVITVANDATPGEVTVIATSTIDNTKSDSCVVTITEE